MRHLMSSKKQPVVAVVLFLWACVFSGSVFAAPAENLNFGQWSLISIPADPGATGTVAAVFADDLPAAEYGSNWLVYAFDSDANQYRLLALNETLEANRGYWIFQRVADPLQVDVPDSLAPLNGTDLTGCPTGQQCVSLPLTSNPEFGVWNAVGYSSDSQARFGETRFVTASGVCAQGCTPDQALTANVAQSVMFTLNSEGTAYEVITEDTPMQPWDGYWLLALPDADQLRWVVPAEATTTPPPAGNQPPVARDDIRGPLNAGNGITLAVTANDTDVDGNVVAPTVNIVQPPAFGTATVTAGGLVVYSHNGETGTGADTITYTVEDNNGAVSNVATITISPIIDPVVEPEPEPGPAPDVTLNDDSITGLLGGQPVTGNVATNDTVPSDAAQQGLLFTVTRQPGNGSVSMNAITGAFTYRPDTGFAGDDFFIYSLVQFDENDNPVAFVASARVNVTIDGLVVVDDSLIALSGVEVSDNVLNNDSLPDNAVERRLQVRVIEQPANGFVTLDAFDGSYDYVSNRGFSGIDTFVYGVAQVDENQQVVAVVAQATVSVDVEPIFVVNDQFSGVSGQAVFGVAGDNDSLPEASAARGFRLSVRTEPQNGTVEMDPVNGAFTYISAEDFVGTDSFTYALVQVDQQGTEIGVISDSAEVQIEINAPVTFYTGADFQGTSWAPAVGSYPSLRGTPVSINTISSIRVEPGFSVFACISTDFRSRCTTYLRDSRQLRGFFNNQIDSVSVSQLPLDVSATPNGVLSDYTISGLSGVATGDTVTSSLTLESDQGYVVTEEPGRGTALMSPTGRYLYTPDEKFGGTDTFEYALVRFNQTGGVAERLAEATVTVDYTGLLSFESEDSSFDNAIGTYELDADGNPTNMQGVFLRSNLADIGQVAGNYRELPRLFLIRGAGTNATAETVIEWDGANGILANGRRVPLQIIWSDARFNSTGLDLVRYETTDDGELLIGFEDNLNGGDGDFTDTVMRLGFIPTAADQAPPVDQ